MSDRILRAKYSKKLEDKHGEGRSTGLVSRVTKLPSGNLGSRALVSRKRGERAIEQ